MEETNEHIEEVSSHGIAEMPNYPEAFTFDYPLDHAEIRNFTRKKYLALPAIQKHLLVFAIFIAIVAGILIFNMTIGLFKNIPLLHVTYSGIILIMLLLFIAYLPFNYLYTALRVHKMMFKHKQAVGFKDNYYFLNFGLSEQRYYIDQFREIIDDGEVISFMEDDNLFSIEIYMSRLDRNTREKISNYLSHFPNYEKW